MKKSELIFKCVLGSEKRNKRMYDAIVQAGIKNYIREEDFVKTAMCLRIDDTWMKEVSPTYSSKASKNVIFILPNLTEVFMKAKMKTIEINGVEYIRKDSVESAIAINTSNIVLVRTYSAGVHFGTLKSRAGKEIILTNARRLYQWSGACSLSQVAVDGVDFANSKISVIVPEITLLEAIEIIPMSEKAAKAMMEAAAWKK